MRLSSIAHLHRVRLKARAVLVQELLAILGLSVGVALLFSSQVASATLNGSVAQLNAGVVGASTYQLQSRSPLGFSEALLGAVERLPGVRAAVPVLETQAVVSGPDGSRSVALIATEPRYVHFAGPLLKEFRTSQLAQLRAIALPAPVAEAVGTAPFELVQLRVGARALRALVGAELSARNIGALVSNPVAIAPLRYAQSIAGMQGRVTRIFVLSKPHAEHSLRNALVRLAGDRENVEPADFEVTLFGVAAAPADKGESLFSWISALVGFLFAFNAMLLTLPLRQGLVRSLRANGATRADIVKALLFDALVLGGFAALLGLALGDLLSLLVFRSNPGYLTFAFPIGSQRIVTWQSIAIAMSAGLLAACLGVLPPLREVFSRFAPSSDAPKHRVLGWRAAALAGGLACVAATTVILVAAPQQAVLGSLILVLALLSLLALLLDGVVAAFDRLQARGASAATRIAVIELRSPDTHARSIAIAAMGAIAVFGSVAIQGAHANLQRGLDRVAHDVAQVTNLWVVPPGTQDLLATTPFDGSGASTLARLPGVRAVSSYQADFLAYGDRYIWVLAPPTTAAHPLPPSQLVEGDLARATAGLRAGGWAVLSQAVAEQHHLHIGQYFTLPSPRPTRLRLAALSTNLSWAPGAVILNPRDYARAWGTRDPSAYNVTLAPGAHPAVVRGEIQRALGPTTGLTVETADQREHSLRVASRQGLSRLSQIALLMALATVLALSIAMGTMVWQRRPRLARMKVQGYERGVLWRALLCESCLLLGSGCAIGALFGVYGQLLISHALATVTGFPIVFAAGVSVAIVSFALVSAASVTLVGLLGYVAVDVPANV